jgi:hypothetical protein
LSTKTPREDLPANIIELEADFVQQFMFLGGFSKLMKAFEVGIKHGVIVHGGERDISLDPSAPFVYAAFNLRKHEQKY